jgi:hypothetical protein
MARDHRVPPSVTDFHRAALDPFDQDRVFDGESETSRRFPLPVPAVIDGAAQSYRDNDKFLVESVHGLSIEEWRRRPSDCTNHMAWLVGHLIWTRRSVLGRLGAEWNANWLRTLCARCEAGSFGCLPFFCGADVGVE